MKRADITKGAEYAVLAPSQKGKVDARYGPRVKRVRVLDTEPLFVSGSGSFGRHNYPDRMMDGFGDDGRVTVTDYTRRIEPDSYSAEEARRVVRCLVGEERYWHRRDGDAYNYRIAVVPISQVAMPWAEYEQRREAATAEAKREERRQRDAERREAERKAAAKAQRDADVATVREVLTMPSVAPSHAARARAAFDRLHPVG
jgi:hypothetical protein